MHRTGRRVVSACDEPCTRVRERHAAAGKREADLTCVKMAREDEVEGPGCDPSDDSGEVTQQYAKPGSRIHQDVWSGGLTAIRLWIDTDDADSLTSDLDLGRLVAQ
jgi:hypothetical protein